MPRLPFLYYVIGLVLFLIAVPAHACTFDRLSPEQFFARASTVFVAHVVRTEEAMGLSPLSDKPEVIVEVSRDNLDENGGGNQSVKRRPVASL